MKRNHDGFVARHRFWLLLVLCLRLLFTLVMNTRVSSLNRDDTSPTRQFWRAANVVNNPQILEENGAGKVLSFQSFTLKAAFAGVLLRKLEGRGSQKRTPERATGHSSIGIRSQKETT